MKEPLKITLRERRGECRCRRGHRIGDTFDFDTERGGLCPLALHTAFPVIDIIRYGGNPPRCRDGRICFACPDPDVLNIFEIETVSVKSGPQCRETPATHAVLAAAVEFLPPGNPQE